MSDSCTVLLYYKFVRIEDPAAFVEEQRALCLELGLKGRILVAEEGLNGTVAGTAESAARYREWCGKHPLLSDMAFKTSFAETMPFKKLSVKARREIVTLGVEGLEAEDASAGNHLSPSEWKKTIEAGDAVLFDVRNDYESAVGRFKNAITPPIRNFRDLPEALKEYGHLREKKILMYCTGGIRCEKAAALFRREGFREVYQLDGGIVTYGEQVGDEHWEGDCFVFDERMAVPVGKEERGPSIAVCAHSGEQGAELVNCADDECHRLFPLSLAAAETNPEFRFCPECYQTRKAASANG